MQTTSVLSLKENESPFHAIDLSQKSECKCDTGESDSTMQTRPTAWSKGCQSRVAGQTLSIMGLSSWDSYFVQATVFGSLSDALP